MKTLARWIFVIAADLSLLLGVCSVAFWTRSHWVDDVAEWERSSRTPLPEDGPGTTQIEVIEIVMASGNSGFRMRVGHFAFPADTPTGHERQSPTALLQFTNEWPPYAYSSLNKMTTVVDRFGLRLEYSKQQPTVFRKSDEVLGVQAPHWMLVVLFVLLPAIRAVIWRRRRRTREGSFCENCGYDLRESKERCPECGLVVECVART